MPGFRTLWVLALPAGTFFLKNLVAVFLVLSGRGRMQGILVLIYVPVSLGHFVIMVSIPSHAFTHSPLQRTHCSLYRNSFV